MQVKGRDELLAHCYVIQQTLRLTFRLRASNTILDTQNEECIIIHFMFEFPCIVSLYYIKNQQDETLAVLFISHCKITLHVSDVFSVHRQEY